MRNRKNNTIPSVGEEYENMDARSIARVRILDVVRTVAGGHACVQNVVTDRKGRISVYSFYNEDACLSSGYRRVSVPQ
jgi:hypothetical protein